MSDFILDNLSVVIPTKNDHFQINKNLEKIVYYLKKNINNYEVIIVSNGSSRESVQNINKLIESKKGIFQKVINSSGKGLAVKNGIRLSNFTNVLLIDSDCSVKIDEIEKFVKNKKLISGLVIGNRRSKHSLNVNSPMVRKLFSFMYNKLLYILFRFKYEDTQCGFKVIDKDIFNNSCDFVSNGFSYDLELILLAEKNGIKVEEIPVNYVHNKLSSVRLLKDSLKMFLEAIKIYQYYK